MLIKSITIIINYNFQITEDIKSYIIEIKIKNKHLEFLPIVFPLSNKIRNHE